ncbi:MAG TPA: inositol 2-dehydrogenase [Arachnia sp.]|nr:inositol 2-dehydrogenase [Arachnia sp.]HMT86602.1 inositol 2-dehydrogenase [Arachnia sp.]
MLHVAIIGAGRIGKVHAHALNSHPEAALVAVCDPIGTAAEDLAGLYGAKAYKDAADVFADPDVDAVIIGSPTPLHAPQVLAAARAGKAVMVEKPVAKDVEEARSLEADLAAFAHPPVMVGFNRRYDPSFARAKAVLDAGEIGTVEQVTIISRDPSAPSADYVAISGGIFNDMTIHDFDMARFFVGDIVEVSAFGQNVLPELKDTGDFDAAVVILRSADGAVATITNNRRCVTGYDQRLEVYGSAGSAFVENWRPTTVAVSTGAHSAAQDPYLDFFLERYADAYRAELSAFVDAVSNGAPVSPTVSDGTAALVIARAAQESAHTGRTVQLG